MKRLALALLLSGAYSLNASFYEKISPAFIKTGYDCVANKAVAGFNLGRTNLGWTALVASWAGYISYKKSKRVRNTVNYLPRKLGLKK